MIIEINEGCAGFYITSEDISEIRDRNNGKSDITIEDSIPEFIKLVEDKTNKKIFNKDRIIASIVNLFDGNYYALISENEIIYTPGEYFSYIKGKFEKIDKLCRNISSIIKLMSFLKEQIINQNIINQDIDNSYDENSYDENYNESNEDYYDEDNEDNYFEISEEDFLRQLLESFTGIMFKEKEQMENTLCTGITKGKSKNGKNLRGATVMLNFGGSLDDLIIFTDKFKTRLLPIIQKSVLLKRKNIYILSVTLEIKETTSNYISGIVNNALEYIDLINNPSGRLMVEDRAYEGLLEMSKNI